MNEELSSTSVFVKTTVKHVFRPAPGSPGRALCVKLANGCESKEFSEPMTCRSWGMLSLVCLHLNYIYRVKILIHLIANWIIFIYTCVEKSRLSCS